MFGECLPPGWSLRWDTEVGGVDALVELAGPEGVSSLLAVEVKLSLVRRDVPMVLEQLRAAQGRLESDAVPMVVARYLAPPVRDVLAEQGACYADATGNLRVQLARPALFVRNVGADHDPWRGPGRPRGTLKGEPAARVVRALADFAPPYGVPELARRSGASTGATYRVVEFLEREALVERRPRGPVTEVRWRSVLERWSHDYGFQRSNSVRSCLHPRGIPALLDQLKTTRDVRYALTGTLAAQRFAPYAPARAAMIYADDPDAVAAQAGLHEVDAGANVLVAANDYEMVFDRTTTADGLVFVAPSQAAVDLLSSPGRSPAEASALLDWMENHESEWRH